MDRYLLEVAVADVDDAINAATWGADRLELNSSLPLGGLTPTPGLLPAVLRAVNVPVIVMIRPRPGGFCYSRSQWQTALADAQWALDAGAHGLACGVLREDRQIDTVRLKELVRLADDRPVVFHRAFDLTPQPEASLEQLIDCGVTRVLSSGQEVSADLGAECLADLVHQAAGRIQILVGGGVRPANLPLLLKTGARQFHGSFSQAIPDPGYEDAPIRFGEKDQLRTVDETTLRQAAGILGKEKLSS